MLRFISMRTTLISMLADYRRISLEESERIFDATTVAHLLADADSKLRYQTPDYVFNLLKDEFDQDDEDNRPDHYFILPEFG